MTRQTMSDGPSDIGRRTLPANLPSIAHAKLPATYDGARTALEKCSRIDECAEWADKASALASYAKQAEDGELQKMAERIRARAIRRCGELLRAIKDRPGARTDLGGASPRGAAAKAAGLSTDQKKAALGVARIPAADFEAAVESDDPPTVTRLLEERKAPKPLVDLEGRNPEDYSTATQALGLLRRFAEFAAHTDTTVVVRGSKPREHSAMVQHVKQITRWLDQLTLRIAKERE